MSVFFSSRKTVLKSWIDTSSIPCYLSSFSSLFLIVIPTAPRYLVDRSRNLQPPRQLLDTQWIDRASLLVSLLCSSTTSSVDVVFLNTYSTDVSTPPQHLICRDLLRILFKLFVRSAIIFLISLQIDFCFLSQTLSSLLQIYSTRFLQASPSFSSLGKLLFSCITCIHVFETKVLGFF